MPTRTRTDGPSTSTARSFGRILRRERELRGLTVREAAAATKVAIRHLEALEADDFDALPGGAYNKGFLRAYAQFIGLDPEDMVNHYLFEISRGRHESEMVPGADRRGRRARARRSRIVVRLAVLAAVAAIAVWLVWRLLI